MPRMRIHCCSSGLGREIAKLFLNAFWEAVAAMHVLSSKGLGERLNGRNEKV